MIVGGDAFCLESARSNHGAAARTRVLNAYGPTEAVVTATLYRRDMTAVDTVARIASPIGQPLWPGTKAYVVDGQEPA